MEDSIVYSPLRKGIRAGLGIVGTPDEALNMVINATQCIDKSAGRRLLFYIEGDGCKAVLFIYFTSLT